MLALSSATCAFSGPSLPVRSAVARATAPAMRQSEALPFLEAPSHCDGTYVGDVVRALRSPLLPLLFLLGVRQLDILLFL